MSYKKINACRVCGNANLVEVLDLGEQDLTGVFPASKSQKVTRGPLKLVKCHGDSCCGLLQLQHTFSLEEMYGDNYGYRSGLNQSMVNHLEKKVSEILAIVDLEPGDLVIDIGSNDGTTLGFYPQGEWELVGIDPSGSKFQQYYKEHTQLIPDFFSRQVLQKSFGDRKCKVVTSFSMFYDLEEPLTFAKEVSSVLEDDGIWVLEQSYMPEMLKQLSYDTICHEHLEYYGLSQIQWIMNDAGLKLVDVSFNDVNGGSFSIIVAKTESKIVSNEKQISSILKMEEGLKYLKPYLEFAENVAICKEKLIKKLTKIKSEGKTVYGIGASTKGNVILQYCDIDEELLPFIGEVNDLKFGSFTPGSLIPIISEDEVINKNPDYVLLLPWHFKKFFETSKKFSNTQLLLPLGID